MHFLPTRRHFLPKIWYFYLKYGIFKENNKFFSGNFENGKVSKYKYPKICVKMRFWIPNITKFYGGVSDTNTNSTKYILETPNNPKYKYFWLFGTPNCHALVKSDTILNLSKVDDKILS